MSEVGNGKAEAVAVSKTKPPARGRETRELLKRASKGDESCLPEVRALLADGDRGRSYRESYGSPAEWLRETIIGKAAGENVGHPGGHDPEAGIRPGRAGRTRPDADGAALGRAGGPLLDAGELV